MNETDAINRVGGEVMRALQLHTTPFHNHHEAHSVILEEFDEYWDLVKLNPRKPMVHPTKGIPLTVEQWKAELQDELVQTAAMAIRALVELC